MNSIDLVDVRIHGPHFLWTHLTLCSSVGGLALKALFGLDASSEIMDLKRVGEQDDKLEVLSKVVSILEQHITEIESSSVSSCNTKSSLQEVIFRMFGKIMITYSF